MRSNVITERCFIERGRVRRVGPEAIYDYRRRSTDRFGRDAFTNAYEFVNSEILRLLTIFHVPVAIIYEATLLLETLSAGTRSINAYESDC